jgi:nucleoside-diphosphate-sugar epimerase
MMNKVYIAGSSGMVGRAVVSTLRSKGRSFIELGRTEDSDICFDLNIIDDFDYDQIECGSKLIFLSAISSPDACETDPINAWKINVINTSKFIEKLLLKNVSILFASSDVVYGANPNTICNEMTPCHPKGVYAKCKYAIENAFLGRAGFHVMRLSYVLGPEDKFIRYLENCHEKKEIAEIFHPFSRNIILINDVVDFCIGYIDFEENYPAVVNLCGESLVSRLDLATNFSKKNPINIEIVEPDSNFFSIRQKIISCESLFLREILGRPLTKLMTN